MNMNKMKFIIKIGFTALVAYLLQWYLPWWSVVIAGFVISVILSSNGVSSFFAAFLGVGLYWFIMAGMIDIGNNSLLADRVARIFFINNSILLVLITAAIGGISGGFGALAGSHLRGIFTPSKNYKNKYFS